MAAVAAASSDYARVAGATFRSVLPDSPGSGTSTIAAFALQKRPVTNADFLAFTREHAEWRRDRVPALFADRGYLDDWVGPDALGAGAAPDQPVTHVSWFAAQAYCETQRARLPSWHEWEWAAAADETRADARGDAQWRQQILTAEMGPGGRVLPRVARGAPDVRGIHDLHGLVWEWVADTGSLMVSADNRDPADPDTMKFCGAGSMLMEDKENYAVLMRIALLSSVRARDTTGRLGFRCARDATAPATPALAAPAAPADIPGDSLYQLRMALQDQAGATIGLDRYRGGPVLVSLFYGTCKNSCPLVLPAIQRLEAALDAAARARVRVMLVSFDPGQDTAAHLRELAERHGADGSRWTLARAADADVRKLAAALGIQYRRLPDGSYHHASAVTLLDASGRMLAQTSQLLRADAKFAARLAAAAAAPVDLDQSASAAPRSH